MADEERAPVHSHNPIVRYFSILGPGLVTGASDDDPSGIATYSIAGAVHDYLFLWTAVLTFLLMAAIQLVCARIGLVTGRGLAGIMVLVMLVGGNRKIMGEHVNGFWLRLLGWTATAIMTAAALAFFLTSGS
jgi:Mn2+/Fe2+ NRAMP family transporter